MYVYYSTTRIFSVSFFFDSKSGTDISNYHLLPCILICTHSFNVD